MDYSSVSAFAVYKTKQNVKVTPSKNKLKRVKQKKIAQQPAKKLKSSKADDEVPKLVDAQEGAEIITQTCNGVNNLELENDDENPYTDSQNLLQWILAPKKLKDFFGEFWECKPLYIQRKQQNYFKHLFSSKKLDEMLRENAVYYTRNVDVVSYENGKRETHNPEGRAVPSAVWDYYQNGCSVRILNPQTYNKKIQLLLATLQEYFGTMVGANVYLTPSGSQGFAPHYDDIEAFVLQLEGRKHWKLYAPKNMNEFLTRESSANLSRDELGPLLQEVTVEAGSVLYFPRGIVHEAKTDSESHSLHLTVSVYQHTSYADLLERLLPAAITKAAQENVQYRKGLPLNYLHHVGVANSNIKSECRSDILNIVQHLTKELSKYIDVDEAADQLGRKFMHDAVPPLLSSKEKKCSVKEDGEFLSEGIVHNKVEFTPDTQVRLLRYHCLRLVVENGQAKIYYCTENSKVYHEEEEQFLEVENDIVPAVVLLMQSYPKYVRIEELPVEDEAQKIQAVSDLWERGILVTKIPLDCVDE